MMERSKRWEIERKLAAMLDEAEGVKRAPVKAEHVPAHTVIAFTETGLEAMASLGHMVRANAAHANMSALFEMMTVDLQERGIAMRVATAEDMTRPQAPGRYRIIKKSEAVSERGLEMVIYNSMIKAMNRILTK